MPTVWATSHTRCCPFLFFRAAQNTPKGALQDGTVEEFRARRVAGENRRSGFYPKKLQTVYRRRQISRRPHRPHQAADGQAGGPDGRRAGKGRRFEGGHRNGDEPFDLRPRLSGQRGRAHRGPADRRAAQAGREPLWRHSHGPQRLRGLRLQALGQNRGRIPLPHHPQRRRVPGLRARDPRRPPLRPHHRPAGRLRPGPHHRRLPPGGPLRRGQTDGGKTKGHGPAARPAHDRRRHPPHRGSLAADRLSEQAGGHGRDVRLRHPPPRRQRPRGSAVAVLWLPGGHQGAERRGHEPGPGEHVPGHLLRAGPGRRHAGRRGRPGADGPVRDEAADGPPPAHPRLQRAVRRRPHVDHRGGGRHGAGRPHPGDQKLFPGAAHPLRPGARPRA